ncbi:MAG: O-antigen ligase domain-containing protein [Symploca sp. SIO1A3]|nr:O-antigen ligase domain-containing protein [Symploca sp. SIO2C1]NER51569.1 O-antigen ligase domain-containing protein [Symploca sp. SIO1A3]
MTYKQTVSSRSTTKGLQLGLQPAPAWTAIIGFILLSALLALAGAGKLLNLAFPAGALAVGVFLYFRAPLLYVGFTWWMWFLTPFVRRLADWKSSYTEPSPILLAPFLVTLVTLVTLWKHLPKTHRQGGLPFVLSFVGMFYGFLIGLINIDKPPVTVCITFLDWLAPTLLAFHLFVNWRDYPSYRQNIQRTFLWGVLVMGVYGVIQFLVAPEWDLYWMKNVGIVSLGKPAPFEINVWSTMEANRPFGTMMMAGLLLLLANDKKGSLGLPATAAGYLSFLLTKKRTTWGSWVVGLLIHTSSLKAHIQMRLIITIMMTALCVVPLTVLEPFSEVINSRFESLSNLEEDTSANDRQEAFHATIGVALISFLGWGIGSDSVDSGLLSTLLDLGWFGTIPYIGGILLLIFSLFQGSESRSDQFVSAARAIVMASFMQMPLGYPHLGSQGMVFWGFLGICIAAKKYYQHQRIHSVIN